MSIAPTLPHDIQAERTVLGALLLDPNAIIKVAGTLRKGHFYDPLLRDIYVAMMQVHDRGETGRCDHRQ